MATIYHGQHSSFEEQGLLSSAGGMADVYMACEVGNQGRQLALKVPKAGLRPDLVGMFLNEAAAASRVASPYVVPLVDWGDAPPFIAFEFMAGGTLGRELEHRRAGGEQFQLAELLSRCEMLSEAMHAINDQVVHRDLKPDNIFVDGSSLRVSDFGISKFVGEVTRSHTFKAWGSTPYMAPETFRADSVDWRSDQYSLGIIFFELATLARPFVGDDGALERAHLYQAPSRVTGARPDLPERFASLISRMLEKRTEKRFESWTAAIAELRAIREKSESDATAKPTDPVLASAAKALDHAKAIELEERRIQEARKEWESERSSLIEYWSNEYFERIQARALELNEQLGSNAYIIDRPRGSASKRITQGVAISFFNGKLSMGIGPVVYENERGAWAWGILDLVTPERISASNLVLLGDPKPYGTWAEVSMKISPVMRLGAHPENQREGEYRIVGQSRLVQGLDWDFLAEQWSLRTTMSVVDYSEQVFSFDDRINTLFSMLTEDGPKTVSNVGPAPRQRRRFDPDFPDLST